MNRRTTEQQLFEELKPLADKFGQTKVLDTVRVDNHDLPIWGLRLGPDDPTKPTFGLFGGVHGLERVGSHVVLHYLKELLNQMQWDQNLRDLFKEVRLVSIPMVNPGGLYQSTRSNPNGVDIMRNAPIETAEKGLRFVSGQNISPKIPWYRGNPQQMEKETTALLEFIRAEMLPAEFSLALDVHSGFGLRDRLWYPFSHTKKSFPYEPLALNFKKLLRHTLTHHVYKVEKQTDSYVIHGDPWDYILLEHLNSQPKNKTFIPWCLEMGSWTWLKKNPTQIFSKTGLFNPILPHRYSRIMRRHRGLLDIFLRATVNHKAWSTKWDVGSPYADLVEKAHTGLEFGKKLTAHSPESLFLDLPGAGIRAHEKSPISIAGVTNKVRDEFLRKKGTSKEPWHILGISLGGMVALDWAKRYPYDFKGAIAINVSSKDSGAFWQRMTPFGMYKSVQSIIEDKVPGREKRILEMVSNLKSSDPKILAAFEAIALERPMKLQNTLRQIFAATNFMAPESLKIPLLLLASLKDHMVDVRCSKQLAEQLHAQIKFHPEAGHELTLDDPDWAMERLIEFETSLTKVQQPSS